MSASNPLAAMEMKGIRVLLFTDDRDMDIFLLTPKENFEGRVPDFETLIDSIQLTNPESTEVDEDGD